MDNRFENLKIINKKNVCPKNNPKQTRKEYNVIEQS